MPKPNSTSMEDRAFKLVRITPRITVAEERAVRLYAAHTGQGWSEAVSTLLYFALVHEAEKDEEFKNILAAIDYR
jgi:hypothetical protein